MNKYIIGIGCSWTQGQGGYPNDVWERYNGRVQLPFTSDYHLRKYQLENSWVNVLCRDYFTDYTPINLGIRGIGNRATVNQLYFCDKVNFSSSTGIVIFMITGLARQDIFSPTATINRHEVDYYSNGDFYHYKWEQLTKDKKIDWNETVLASEFVLNLLHAQTFCERYNFKLIFANAFEPIDLKSYTHQYALSLAEKVNWEGYLHNATNYVSLLQHLIRLDGLVSEIDYYNGKYIDFYRKRDYPTKYLTNCNGSHPNLEGYKAIASELATFIKQWVT